RPARELASGRVRCGVDARGALAYVRLTGLTAREAELLEEHREGKSERAAVRGERVAPAPGRRGGWLRRLWDVLRSPAPAPQPPSVRPERRRWIDAAVVLSRDPEVRVPCPTCGRETLRVMDADVPLRPGIVDRYIQCPWCRRHEVLSGVVKPGFARDPATGAVAPAESPHGEK
ncbi:MAG TPA: hypothetical protein VF771_19915, partial [Longimicrobiaceae bacterium]